MKSTIEIAKELISIPSSNASSNVKIVSHIKSYFKDHELLIQEYQKDKVLLQNIIIKIKGEKSDNPIVFAGHTDTVDPVEGWKRSPFETFEESGKLFGLGTSDMKSAIACMIVAALESKPTQDIYLMFTADEEGGGTGIDYLIKNYNLNNARIVVGEPSDGNLARSNKGCIELKITTFGSSGHSSLQTQSHSENAIVKATKIIRVLIEHSEGESKESEEHIPINIGAIKGGAGPNTIVSKCEFLTSQRIAVSEDLSKIYSEILKLIQECDPSAKVEILFSGNSYELSVDDPFLQTVQSIAQSILGRCEIINKKGWTEAARYCEWGSAVIIGPGSIFQAHQPNEFVSIDDLEKFTKLYKSIMEAK